MVKGTVFRHQLGFGEGIELEISDSKEVAKLGIDHGCEGTVDSLLNAIFKTGLLVAGGEGHLHIAQVGHSLDALLPPGKDMEAVGVALSREVVLKRNKVANGCVIRAFGRGP